MNKKTNYKISLITGEELEITADGHNIYEQGKVLWLYVVDGRNRKTTVMEIVLQNVLYWTTERESE